MGTSDKTPFCINRRYSNFEQLYHKLCKRFPLLAERVNFPGKVLIGNFKSRIIADRSRRFEHFLHILSEIEEVRLSTEFVDFFCGDKIKEAYNLLTQNNNNKALPVFQELWLIMLKIAKYQRSETMASLIALVVISFSLEQFELSQSYVETALSKIGEQCFSHFLKPLLHFGIRLYWTLGKDKCDLEHRLQQLEGSYIIKDLNCSPVHLLRELALNDLVQNIVK